MLMESLGKIVGAVDTSGDRHGFDGDDEEEDPVKENNMNILSSSPLMKKVEVTTGATNDLDCSILGVQIFRRGYIDECAPSPPEIISLNATVLSINRLQGSPLVIKLASAAGIVIFAIWGLAPLVRQSRNIFLSKSDDNWTKSSTYHVITSYIQPLLLWAGAIFICRALDPVILPSEASQIVKQRLLNFVRSLSTVLAFAHCLSSVIQQSQKFFMETNDTTETRNMGFQFAGRAVYTAVWVASVSLFMELLGFSTQKWITAGGFGTVLLTLAGREHVGWWSPTIIRGDDREAVHIPNHKFTVNVNIVADMRKVLAKNPQVEQQKLHRRVFLDNINPENQALLEAILHDLLRVITHHRARLATPIRTVQKMHTNADLDGIPFSDTVFNGEAASTRPFLLIEPPYKINGEDKTKTQARSARVDANSETTPITDAKFGEKEVTDSNTKEIITSDDKAKSPPEPKIDNSKTKSGTSSTSQQTQDLRSQAPVTKPSLDENIVLGVALEGSKRMLPIEEEDMVTPSNQEDSKELAASRSGNGSKVAEKGKSDIKRSNSPSSPAGDQLDQQE
ncbi:hypothetical protein DH2020_013806 [Rehmannia glutinosa]|uniref:Mechanosensitive ion channel protein n=1 Tax=Rehmannia glutinosa TaxID=99300 RepID=A0ABR0X6E5_REHGL